MSRTYVIAASLLLTAFGGAACAGEFAACCVGNPAYVSAKAGAAFENLDSITNTSPYTNPASIATTSKDGTTAVLGAAAGLNFRQAGIPIRVELEYAYRTDFDYNPNPLFSNAPVSSSAKSTLNSHTVMANAYYDIDTGTKFTPYVGGGLGVAINQTSATLLAPSLGLSASADKTHDSFAWALNTGVGYAINAHWTADLGYRYLDLGKAVYGGQGLFVTAKSVTSNEVAASIRYQF